MPNVGDVYRISQVGQGIAGEPFINTYYYRISVVGSGDEKAALNGAFVSLIGPVLAPLLPTTYTGVNNFVQPVKPVGTVEVNPATVAVGTNASAGLPNQLAVILTRHTATPGKGGRGRIFHGPIPANHQQAADPNKIVAGTYNTYASDLLTNLTSGGWTFVPVLWKRKTLSSVDLTNVTWNQLIKTRRSRAEGTRFHRRRKHTVGSI